MYSAVCFLPMEFVSLVNLFEGREGSMDAI